MLTFDELLTSNVERLKSLLVEFVEAEDETLPILKNLIDINEKGILTTCGQPGMRCSGFSSEPTLENIWFEEEKKPFLEFMILKNEVDSFLSFIENHPSNKMFSV